MSTRVRGQETRIIVSGPRGVEQSIDAVKSFEAEFNIDILSEGYLGEVAERQDEIFIKVTGKMEIHIPSAAYFQFAQSIIDRAQRRTSANQVFNITTSLTFPDGRRVRTVFKNVSFGSIPLNVGARDEYVSTTLEFATADASFIL